jgi:ubiquinol-cytochrome c reductase cytochrome b subunit
LGICGYSDKISFYPYFVVKDLFSWVFFFIVYFAFVFFDPNYLGHTDNYIEANPMITPAHIVPEWYFRTPFRLIANLEIILFGCLLVVNL